MGLPFWGKTLRPGHGYDGPIYAPNEFDRCQLGDLVLPGKCSVEALPEHVYDRQKVEGRDGATLVLRGYLPGPIDIEWFMWREDQWEIAQEIIAKIWRKPGKLAPASGETGTKKKALGASEVDTVEERAIDIRHPALLVLNVHRVVIKGISPPKPGGIPQSRILNIKCLEYVPTPKKVQKPTRVTGSKAKLKEPAAFLKPQNGFLDPPSKTAASPLPKRTPPRTPY